MPMLLFRPHMLDKQTGHGACLLVWRGFGTNDGCQVRCPYSLTGTMRFISRTAREVAFEKAN